MSIVDVVPSIARRVFGTNTSFDHLLNGIQDDDCGILATDAGCLIVSTDLMNHKPALMTMGLPDRFFNYGYLMAAANLSDLYGTGGKPIALLVGLLTPTSMSEKQIERLLQGVHSCCRKNQVPVIGGDTKRSDRLQGYGVAIGWAESQQCLFTRDRARAGQIACVSGELGDFNAAAYSLAKGGYPKEWQSAIRQAMLRPKLRRRLSLGLAKRQLATGGIDISDGFGLDLWHLATQSNVSLKIAAGQIPVGSLARSVAAHYQIDPLAFVFATGGDWQFAFTCDTARIDECVRLGGVPIGTVVEGEDCWLERQGDWALLPRFGHSDDRGLEFGEEVILGVETYSTTK